MESHLTPNIRAVWNQFHGFVDQHHQLYSEIHPSNKSIYVWKHKFSTMRSSLTMNSFINFRTCFEKDKKKYTSGKYYILIHTF